MGPGELLRHAVGVLEQLGVPYFITGSTASIVYGEPRFTNDLDVVIDLSPEMISAFCAGFPPSEFYLSEQAVRDSVRARHQFNVLHPGSGWKVDFILLSNSDFDNERIRRKRKLLSVADCVASFASPEDVIIKKMLYYREGGSEKHLRDIAGVVRIQGAKLDIGYIETWTARFALDDIWQMIREAEQAK